MKKLLAMLAVAAALGLSASNSLAQDNGGGGGGGGGRRGGGGGGGGFDPQQMMDNIKERLGFTNDTDWSAVQPLVQKVMDARREQFRGGFGGFGGRRRGGNNGDNGGGNNPNRPTNPDADALQQAIDSNAPAAQIKTLLDKYRASQKSKQEALAKAQADLQKVLTPKQEAQAVLMQLLN